jgi:hypothetical protein
MIIKSVIRLGICLMLTYFLLIPPVSAQSMEQLWVARYNGPDNSWDRANALALDGAGNVYVTGSSYGSDSNYDYATVKYDANGNQLWVARYNGPGNSYDFANALALDGAGNLYVTGSSYGSGTNYDYATVKYDANGNQLWVARYNGLANGWDVVYALALDASGNVHITGYSYGSGTDYDYATVKYDANGNQLWVARYNGPGSSYDFAQAMALDAAGNVYVTGSSYGSGTDCDYATVKYDANGNQLWVARYNGPGNGYDDAWALAVDDAGNAYVAGYSYGSGTDYDYATLKYDANGNQQWVARYNGPDNSYDFASAMALDAAGNVYVTGYSYGSGTDYDYATVKYDANGNQQWVDRYNGPGNSDDIANALALDAAGNVYVTGSSYGSGTSGDYATVNYDNKGPIASDVVATPNPVSVDTDVDLTATVDDTETGGSTIMRAEYSIDGGTFVAMNASDGSFDQVVEDVCATIQAFDTAGVHSICVRAIDEHGNEGGVECIFLAVYDPDAGFVTGGGWIDSPPGAYTPDDLGDPDYTGKANFGFVSKYKKGATIPTGETAFHFKVADLNFHSDSYDWLVVSGAKAKYKGIGTINGQGEYKFMLTAIDADINDNDPFYIDRFRIKIWQVVDSVEIVIYDNALGSDEDSATTELGGGSIIIHEGED